VNGTRETVSADRAITHVSGLLHKGAIGIGSTKASLEANHALRRLVGAENFFAGIDTDEAKHLQTILKILKSGAVRTPTLRGVEDADAVLILGEDLSNTAPRLDLAVRQAVLNRPKERARELGIPEWNDSFVRLVVDGEHGPLFIATPSETALDEIATRTVRAAPQDIARLGFGIASTIDPDAPSSGALHDDLARLIGPVSKALVQARAPLVIAGTGSGSAAIIEAAANVVSALNRDNPSSSLSVVVPDCNSVGVGLLEAADLTAAAVRAELDEIDTAIVLEPDLSSRGRKGALDAIFDAVDHVVVLDHLEGPAAELAEVVLPSATFAESGGTLVNNESRAQRFFQVFVPAGDVRASWLWLGQIDAEHRGDGATAGGGSLDVAKELAEEQPVFRPIADLMPSVTDEPRRRVPRQTHRVSGRTAVNAHLQIREPRPPDDTESPLAYSMEGSPRHPPAGLITRYWSPGWNSVQSLTRFQEEIGGPLRGGDPGVRLGDPPSEAGPHYFDDVPEAFAPRPDEWLLVPLHHLFGSEPLSLEAPGVANEAPEPYIALNPDDGDRIGVEAGETLAVEIGGQTVDLVFKPDAGLPAGCAGLPTGLPAPAVLPAGRWARLGRRS
jgi:NADH-quinone oxidoreductase subunit G